MISSTRLSSLLSSFLGAVAALVVVAVGTPAAASVPGGAAWVVPYDCDPVRVRENRVEEAGAEHDAAARLQVARFNGNSVANSSRGVGRATGGGLNNLRGKRSVQQPANSNARRDRAELRRDKREVRQDANEVRKDRREVRKDPTDQAARRELRQDKQDLRQDTRDLRQDRRDIRTDRRQQATESKPGQQ